jgi:succinate dehydrogenase/fumarate reductase cytochrome b subunit
MAEGRIPERRLAQIQAVSGLAFATFLAIHLVNTAIAALGQLHYDAYQRAMRLYYQAPGIELLLVVVAPAVHVAVGVVRWRRRRAKRREPGAPRSTGPLRTRLHRAAGYFLLVVIGGHAIATRGPGLIAGEPADFSFLTFSLVQAPWIFYPYYVLFGIAGAYHLVNGTLAALPVLRVHLSQRWLAPGARRFWVPAGVLAALVACGVLALGGAFFEVDTSRFSTWHGVYARFVPWLPLHRGEP